MEQQIQNMQQDEIEIDLKDVLRTVWKNAWKILLIGILGAVLAGVGTYTLIKPVYESTSKLYVSGNSASSTIASLTSLQLGSQLTTDYAELLTTRPVLEEVIRTCKVDMDYKDLEKEVTVGTADSSRVMTITVADEDPETARKLVDAFSDMAVEQICTVLESNQPVIVEDGSVAEQPANRNLIKNVALGGICGIVITGFVVILCYVLDGRIKKQEELEACLQVAALGVIPASGVK